jgi:hypothetical protein
MVLCPKHKVLLEGVNSVKFRGIVIPAYLCPYGEVWSYEEIYGVEGLKNYFSRYGEELTLLDLELIKKYYEKWREQRETMPRGWYIEIEKELTPEEMIKFIRKTPETVAILTLLARVESLEKVVMELRKLISEILERLK